uniref:Lipid droplet-associated hydrolase n=1 Tax=Strongyloides papillosus TaxID=174720 RepID=A0A0N5B3L6_STREA
MHYLKKWIKVSGYWTRLSIISQKPLLFEGDKFNFPNDTNIIFMIPGNPGNDGYYNAFGRRLLDNLIIKKPNDNYVFLTISHVNHVKMEEDNEHKGNVYKLDFQVDHKYNFVDKFLGKKNEIIMMGHSIGSFMMLKIYPRLVESGYKNIGLVFGLFPTIERMSASPNGQRLYSTLKFLDNYPNFTKCLTLWFDILPICVKKFLINCNFGFNSSIPSCIIESTVELFNTTVLRNIIHMSRDELDNVIEYDFDLRSYANNVYLYYGLKDGWVPLSYGDDMRNRKELNDGHVIFDTTNSEHAFVIKESEIIADKLTNFI